MLKNLNELLELIYKKRDKLKRLSLFYILLKNHLFVGQLCNVNVPSRSKRRHDGNLIYYVHSKNLQSLRPCHVDKVWHLQIHPYRHLLGIDLLFPRHRLVKNTLDSFGINRYGRSFRHRFSKQLRLRKDLGSS